MTIPLAVARPTENPPGKPSANTRTRATASADARERFALLYRESRDDVYAYVCTLLRDRSAAEDVTAAAFERALRKRDRFDATRGSERAWIFGIARNAALDELRRRSRSSAPAFEPAAQEAAVGDTAETAIDRATLERALLTLAPREREVIALRFHGDLSHREVALVLGVTESNAGTLLHRAINQLRKACHDDA